MLLKINSLMELISLLQNKKQIYFESSGKYFTFHTISIYDTTLKELGLMIKGNELFYKK